jgi:hypothetical protein
LKNGIAILDFKSFLFAFAVMPAAVLLSAVIVVTISVARSESTSVG